MRFCTWVFVDFNFLTHCEALSHLLFVMLFHSSRGCCWCFCCSSWLSTRKYMHTYWMKMYAIANITIVRVCVCVWMYLCIYMHKLRIRHGKFDQSGRSHTTTWESQPQMSPVPAPLLLLQGLLLGQFLLSALCILSYNYLYAILLHLLCICVVVTGFHILSSVHILILCAVSQPFAYVSRCNDICLFVSLRVRWKHWNVACQLYSCPNPNLNPNPVHPARHPSMQNTYVPRALF